MDLMRRLRDGEVKVEGDKMVEQLQPTLNSKGKARAIDPISSQSMGGLWARDYEQRAREPSQAWPQALEAAKTDLQNRMHEMNEVFEAEDDVRARRQALNRFQGDGGRLGTEMDEEVISILQDPSETEALRSRDLPGPSGSLEELLEAASQVGAPEWEKWKQTAVPGASEAWVEEFEEENEDLSGMFGRPLTLAELDLERHKRLEALPSTQQLEWEALQDQWSQTFETQDQIQELEQVTGYSFQHVNHHHSFHDHSTSVTAALEGMLASVCQKEAEVLESPDSARAWFELGLKQQENEREDQAIAALKRAITLDPLLAEARLALAISYTNENRRSEAFEELEQWMRDEMGSVAKYADVLAGVRGGEGGESIEALASRHQVLTQALMRMARLGGRIEGCGTIDADVQVALGVLFNTSEEYEKACDCFGAALAVRPDDPLLYNRLGATLANNGKSEEAIELS